MAYKTIGAIENISEIPLNQNLIVTGSVSNVGWMWRIEGIFKHTKNGIVFKDTHGCAHLVDENISLSILKKIYCVVRINSDRRRIRNEISRLQ